MIEPLESRRLLSTPTVAESAGAGILDTTNTKLALSSDSGSSTSSAYAGITGLVQGGIQSDFAGTSKNDQIQITSPESGVLVVTMNGVSTATTSHTLRINAEGGNDYISAELLPADADAHITLYGGAGNDTITGGAEADRIFAGDGNDVVNGGGGKDTIYGEAGDDSLRGGGANDLLDGGDGEDTLRGDAGNDNLSGGANSDHLRGSAGNDTLSGGGSRDLLAGEDGDDSLSGSIGDDVLSGGNGNDTLRGDAGRDYLAGDAGQDDLGGGSGVDSISGGAGVDTFYTTSSNTYADDVNLIYDSDLELTDIPPVPANFAATLSNETNAGGESIINFTWTPADDNVNGYDIQDSTDGGKTWTDADISEPEDHLSAELEAPADNATHIFRVRSDYLFSYSAYSPVSQPVAVPPSGANGLQGYESGDSFLFSWYDDSVNESGFQLFSKAGDGPFTKIASIAANPDRGYMTHTARNLKADTQYSFFVRTLFANGATYDSETLDTTTYDPALNLGADEVSIPPGGTVQIQIQLFGGADPSDFSWIIDWGDYSDVTTIPKGASPSQLIRSHVYAGKDFDTSWTIDVHSPDTTWYSEAFKTVNVAAQTS